MKSFILICLLLFTGCASIRTTAHDTEISVIGQSKVDVCSIYETEETKVMKCIHAEGGAFSEVFASIVSAIAGLFVGSIL